MELVVESRNATGMRTKHLYPGRTDDFLVDGADDLQPESVLYMVLLRGNSIKDTRERCLKCHKFQK